MQHKVTGVAILIAVPSLYEANPATASETQLLLWLQPPSAMSALWCCGHSLCEAPVALLHPWRGSGVALTVLAHLGIACTIFGAAGMIRCHWQGRWVVQVRSGDSILWRFNGGYGSQWNRPPKLRARCVAQWYHILSKYMLTSSVQIYCHLIFFKWRRKKVNACVWQTWMLVPLWLKYS